MFAGSRFVNGTYKGGSILEYVGGKKPDFHKKRKWMMRSVILPSIKE
jgi:hypothetical protein